jgi:hypothetical protein
MAKQIKKRQNEVIQKQEVLDNAKVILKLEFIGIDTVIEQLVDAVSSWYLFPDLQEKPVIINLWGLTGVGKSSLVHRLAQLLEYEDKYYHFDLGDRDSIGMSIKSKLVEVHKSGSKSPVLLAFDEFQHARTIGESGEEVDSSASRILWQILDTGNFSISRFSYSLENLFDLMLKLRYLLHHGVRVSKGKVVANAHLFIEKMELKNKCYFFDEERLKSSLESGNISFVPDSYIETIYQLAGEKFSSQFEVRETLDVLNGIETINFLDTIITIGNSDK